MGGADKPALTVAGSTLLARALDAVPQASPLVVVGPRRDVAREVVWTAEEPPGGGPLAALDAGLTALVETGRPEFVAVLASDYPNVTEWTVQRLIRAVRGGASGAVLVDEQGAPQWLLGVWRTDVLQERMPTHVRDRPLRAVLSQVEPVLVPAAGSEAVDVDTPEDLRGAGGDLSV